MKKIIAGIALSIFALASTATELSVGYGFLGVADQPGTTQQENSFLQVKQATGYGNVSAALTGANSNGSQKSQSGYEVGYEYPVALDKTYSLVPRVAYGDVSTKDAAGLGIDGHYFSYGIEGKFSQSRGMDLFAAADFKKGVIEATAATERSFQIGAEYVVAENLSIRGALAHRSVNNVFANGVLATVKFAF